jgi:hypothetical protein
MTNQPQQDTEVTLKIQLKSLDVIMAGLDELPQKFARPVTDELVKQVNEQLQGMQQGLPEKNQGLPN